ncbi:hypothetical protein [Butyrivibrio sp.]|uniref:hypothetical protein n=1 Tax=Butyrivibrio sp. TaxID=28121 RepID=UPI0025C11429|nr:hypothetical protein [Butyrivibrio sp.]MBQ9302171.1 hypothetical protein [Butyrivibrio sp.]
MSKGLGKFLAFAAVAGAAAAGVYYYLNQKGNSDFDDFDDDDFDDFEDDDFDDDDTTTSFSGRKYVNIDSNKEENTSEGAKEETKEEPVETEEFFDEEEK